MQVDVYVFFVFFGGEGGAKGAIEMSKASRIIKQYAIRWVPGQEDNERFSFADRLGLNKRSSSSLDCT